MASEDSSGSPPPPCDVAIVIDRSSMDVSHAGYTGPTSLSCSSVTDLGDGLCADSNSLIATGSTQKVRAAHRRRQSQLVSRRRNSSRALPYPQACVDAAYTDPSCANALEVSWDAATGACRCDTKASCALSSPGDASWRRLTCAEDGVGPSSAGVAPFVDALVRELSTDAGRRVSLIVYPPNADGAGDEGRGDVSGDAATRVSLRSAPPCRGEVGGCAAGEDALLESVASAYGAPSDRYAEEGLRYPASAWGWSATWHGLLRAQEQLHDHRVGDGNPSAVVVVTGGLPSHTGVDVQNGKTSGMHNRATWLTLEAAQRLKTEKGTLVLGVGYGAEFTSAVGGDCEPFCGETGTALFAGTDPANGVVEVWAPAPPAGRRAPPPP